MVSGIQEYEFQTECVKFLIDKTYDPKSKQIITVKAPTGAGKTVILIQYVDAFLKNTPENTAFIWLCPGKGDLEQQSEDSMEELTPHLDHRPLVYSLSQGFPSGSITFINWELVTKKGNIALKDSEFPNLYKRIADAHRDGIQFIVIVDEEHSNDTDKARGIIDAFAPKNIIRVSATPKKVDLQEFYEISEEEVINAGLITTAIYVNEAIMNEEVIDEDYNLLLDLADHKRKELLAAYEQIGAKIRPLVIVQFPSGMPEYITAVEEKLKTMGYTYDNGMVNIWMSDNHFLSDDLTDNDGQPAFLLMKQAIATGWDCPRAKILVKLREGGDQKFQIQTIGRIRRMPERKHYDGLGFLNFCYLYTLDQEYKQGLLTTLDRAYQTRILAAKKQVRSLTLTKQMRDKTATTGLSSAEMTKLVFDFMTKKYSLGTSKEKNKDTLEAHGFSFAHELDTRILQGLFRTADAIGEAGIRKTISVKTTVNTHTHGVYLLHARDEIKRVTGISEEKVKVVLRRLFRRDKKRQSYKLISLNNNDFYAFVINNIDHLKEIFREIMASQSGAVFAGSLTKEVLTSEFTIPETEIYKFSAIKEAVVTFEHNAYEGYTNEFITDKTRSLPEKLFEQYCENNSNVEWYYKNGDRGQQYFSIVYTDGFKNQWLFYPDYIVKLKDGRIWIIETKGGWAHGYSKNIDIQVANKFTAFKEYAAEYDVLWGFVRDFDENLYFCNTEYTDNMMGDNWLPLDTVF